MSAAFLIERARTAGAILRLDEAGRVRVTAPESGLEAALVEELRAVRDEVSEILRQETSAAAVPTPLGDGGRGDERREVITSGEAEPPSVRNRDREDVIEAEVYRIVSRILGALGRRPEGRGARVQLDDGSEVGGDSNAWRVALDYAPLDRLRAIAAAVEALGSVPPAATSPGTAERARPASEGISDPSADDTAAALISLAERAAFPRLDLFSWGVVSKGEDGWHALVHRLDGDAAWLAHATAALRLVLAGEPVPRWWLGPPVVPIRENPMHAMADARHQVAVLCERARRP